MKLRIKFTKYGPVKFIGHLDVMRYFQKAIRRAAYDIRFTGGFSPHPIMTFAAPLGVGMESGGEYMDIEVNSSASSAEMKERLNAVMAEGIEILSVRLLPDGAGNAMASVAAAEYLVTFREGREPGFPWKEACGAFFARETIMLVKKTKKGTKELDLKQYLFKMEAEEDGIHLLTDASSSGNLKPSLVMEAFYTENGAELGEFDIRITRQETFGRDGSGSLTALEEFGSDMP